MANEEQLDILKQGTLVWNDWRKEHPDVRPDLYRVNLSEADFSEADLRNANLSSADLSSALQPHFLTIAM